MTTWDQSTERSRPGIGVPWRRLVVALILLLAAALRLTRLGLIEFKFDEATMARNALAVAREGRFPAVGMVSSQGAHNPPLMSYVLAVPFALSYDPRLAAGWIALIGVAAVGLTYWIGRSYFGWREGALAALLFAVNPWAVFQSRKIWAQNLPALTLLFLAALLAVVVRRRSWALVGTLAATAGLVGLHLGGLAFIFVFAVVAAIFYRRMRLAPLLIGLAAFLLILSPYLIHNARHGWPDLRALARLGQSEAAFNPQAFWMAGVVASGYQLQSLAGERHAAFMASILDLSWLDQLEMLLFWGGLLWLAWRVARQVTGQRCLSREARAQVVLLVWFLVPVMLLTRRSPVYPHDFNLLYPVQHLVIALFLVALVDWARKNEPRSSRFWSYVRRFWTYFVVLFLALLVVWQIYLQETLLAFVDAHETPGGYGAPVKYALAAAERVKGSRSAIIALVPGDDPRYEGTAAVFDVLLRPARYRLVDGRRELVLPSDQSVTYLVHPRAGDAAWRLTEVAEESAALPLRGGSEAHYRFFQRHSPLDDWAPAHPTGEEPMRWAVGATLLGYDWRGDAEPGGTIRWTLAWRVDGPAPGEGAIHWFNHLMDAEGARWGQKDAAAFPPSKWREGDLIVSWFDIPIAPEAPEPPYVVRSGLYTYPDLTTIPLVDVAGKPAAAFVELGPIGATP